MSIKKFVAPDMRVALKLIRDELGPDAVILSNRKVANGVEITAASDYDAMVDKHQEKQREQQRREARLPGFADDGAPLGAPVVEAGRVIRPIPDQRDPELRDQRKPAVKPVDSLHAGMLAAKRSAGAVSSPAVAPAAAVRPGLAARATAPAEGNDAQARELLAMRNELNKMRTMLDSRFAHVAWSDFRHQSPVQAAACKQLHRMGVSASLCRRYVRNLEAPGIQEGMRVVMQRMGREISLFENDIRDVGGVYAFVGPAGVGKTTSISKIAASFALRHGTDEVALVTTDSYRIAGHEQLRTLGRILGVPVRVVSEQHPLEEILEELSHKRLVLVDTAGLGRRDQDFQEQMDILDALPEHVKRVLVLASTSQRRTLEKAVRDYQNLQVDACIITKLDECESLGEALSVVVESGLAVAFTTDGQNIPDDIMRPNVAEMLNQALLLARSSDLEDEDTADWFDSEIAGKGGLMGAA